MDHAQVRFGGRAVETIADLARRAEQSTFSPRAGAYKDAAPFVVLRDGDGTERIEYLTGKLPEPHRKFGTVKLFDAESFIAYYQMHGNGAPVYATLNPKARFIAVLNEHTAEKAGWRDHRADFTVSYSKEWETWIGSNGADNAFKSNEAFALFLEDNAPDIVSPDAAKMVSIALNFKMNANVNFSLAQRLTDGHVEFGYSNVVQASATPPGGGKLKIPEQFTIEVPVFDGLKAKRYKVDARFRYRLHDGNLSIWYELIRPHKVVEQAFQDVWQLIQKETRATILYGTPE